LSNSKQDGQAQPNKEVKEIAVKKKSPSPDGHGDKSSTRGGPVIAKTDFTLQQ
jgi:hypothetical protein